jgi:Zn-dependent protease
MGRVPSTVRLTSPAMPVLLAQTLFIETLATDRQYFFAVVITVVVSICIHELAHGIVAIWLGDRTPIESGHMTLNPAVHMGGFSIVLLLLAGIAWGAMPVDPTRLRGRLGGAIVALAGPASNLILAAASLAVLVFWARNATNVTQATENLWDFLQVFGFVNVHLAIFNLLPVPPLDGARVLANFSRSYDDLMNRLAGNGGLMIVFAVVFLFAGKFTGPAAAKVTSWYVNLIAG